ncbi:hypothetical protein VTO42DRAFT_6155 [Malbranchea cinnamomea]
MASLSEKDRDIIARHPLDSALDNLRKPLQDVDLSYANIRPFDGPNDNPEFDRKKVILRLLGVLLGTEAAFTLRSKVSGSNVTSDLTHVTVRVLQGDLNYGYFHTLVKLVIDKACDLDIWSAVFDLIHKLSRMRRLVEARVFDEICSCTYRNVDGFYEKFFDKKDWTDRARDIYKSVKNQHVNGRWRSLPDSPTQTQVQDLVFRLQEDFLSKEKHRYYTINLPNELTGDEARRQVDLIVKQKCGESSGSARDWKDVEVIGELKASNSNGIKKTLVQLSCYARDVFACQPTRRFLHAFTICGRAMEVWVFDRSGCYSPGPFDIHNEPE